ncbi:MAG: serine protease [Acholeplasmataceae bacterium]|nr:serine protease [Acholeplasmataceae bacterium]
MKIINKILMFFLYGIFLFLFLGFLAYSTDLHIGNYSSRHTINHFLKTTENTLKEFVFNINDTPYVRNISISKDDTERVLNGTYVALITFDNTEFDYLNSITLNNIKYTDFFELPHDKYLVIMIKLGVFFTEDETSKTINLTSYEVNGKVYNTSLSTIAFREINYDIVDSKKESVVGIQVKVSNTFGSRAISWGSGIIFKKVELSSGFGGLNKIYEYYILTNAHVVDGGNEYIIHYQNQTNTYPKYPKDKVELIGTYTVNTDIAILKLTTRQNNIKALNDAQFETKVPVEIREGQVVFAIGSPVNEDGGYDFNNTKEGIILDVHTNVYIKDDKDLCINGCESFQTSAMQGNGSSGGGIFNALGDLIGLHFAANLQNGTASEIPMSIVLIAIDDILSKEMIKQGKIGLYVPSYTYFSFLN